jgi:hypothetical protein
MRKVRFILLIIITLLFNMASVSFATSESGDGLYAEFFNNMSLSGTPTVTRVDPTVNFTWGYGSPDSRIYSDRFSTRWTGEIKVPQAGIKYFDVVSDDGVRVWINGSVVLDSWRDQSPTHHYFSYNFQQDQFYDIKIEYYENGGGAVAQILWNSNNSYQAVPQSVLYSNTDRNAPITTLDSNPSTPINNGWYTSDVAVVLSAIDDKSGVLKTEFRINNGAWTVYTGTFILSNEGTNIVYYKSTDNSGNIENFQSKQFNIDKTYPTTSLSVNAPNGNKEWYSSTANVSLSAVDNVSGIDRTEYRINEGDWITYTNYIIVNDEGVTTIDYRSVDKAGLEEAFKTNTIKLDKTAPITSSIPSNPDGVNGWYLSDASLILTANDNTSGVAKTEYRENGIYNIIITSEGTASIDYKSTDNTGNEETFKTISFNLDKSKPVTMAVANADKEANGWYASDVSVSLIANDAVSGVGETEYHLNNGGWIPYTNPFVLTNGGTTTVYYRSLDIAGNVEEVKTLVVKLDKTSPSTSLNVESVSATNKWYNSDITISLVSIDEISGISGTQYRVNGGIWNTYTGSFTISNEGTILVEFQSIDNAGNVEPVKSINFNLDKTAPLTTDNAPSRWSKDNVTVSLTPSDNGSGVSATYYSLDGGIQQIGTTVIVTGDAVHTLTYWSVDSAGNIESMKTATIQIDKTGPVTTATPGLINGQNGWYISNPTISLSASDNLSGVTQTLYHINTGPWVNYTEPVSISTEGINTFEYKSVDIAGNEEVAKSLTIKLDKSVPTLKVVLDKKILWPPDHKLVTVTASVYAYDSISQIGSIVLSSITSNEPDKGLGEGDQPNDIQGTQYGIIDTTFKLRAERSDKGSGRIYTLTYTATDKAGNKTIASATVTVPRDQLDQKEQKEQKDHSGK